MTALPLSSFLKNLRVHAAALLCLLCAAGLRASAPQRVSIADFGARPGSREDVIPAVRKALEACKQLDSAILVFPRGRYDFYAPANTGATYGIALDGHKNLVIDGDGSEFIFHGIIGVGRVVRSENITLRNFTVDWDSPFIVQGAVGESGGDWIDVQFDTARYPFEIDGGKLYFKGESWRRPLAGYSLLYDKNTFEIVPKTADNALAPPDRIGDLKTEDRGNGIVRFYTKPRYKTEPGNLLLLGLGRYIVPAFTLHENKDVALDGITVHHALSHGVAAFRTENITLSNVNLRANRAKGRVFSVIADGFHLNTCKGLIKIENCEHTGIGDDFLNVHGHNVIIRDRVDARTLEVDAKGRGNASSGLRAGDEVWFVNAATMQRGPIARIAAIHDLSEKGKGVVKRRITFEAALPEDIKTGDLIENKTWCPALEMRGCRILKTHRARGILVTTPKRAVIENNYFSTAGTAILIEGDSSYWYESGACLDLIIRNNVFEDCFTSGQANTWGRAVITIHPSFKPKTADDAPYHRNIRIEKNVFKSFDYPILFARSAGNLRFEGNTLLRTKTHEPFAAGKFTFTLDGCRDVTIGGNTYGGDVLGKNISLSHMRPEDLTLKDAALHIKKTVEAN